jgi:hypothetical protein
MEFPLRYVCRSYDPDSTKRSWLVLPPKLSRLAPHSNLRSQTAALAMEEQERAVSEETEKRLKAALSAKREPAPTASRLASPAVAGTGSDQSSDQKMEGDERSSVGEVPPSEDVTMEVSESTSAPVADVSTSLPCRNISDTVRRRFGCPNYLPCLTMFGRLLQETPWS